MDHIIEGLCLIGRGIGELFQRLLMAVLSVFAKGVRRWRKWRLKRATAYVNKYGYALDLNSRVLLDEKAYYVFSLAHCRDIEKKREVQLCLIGVPQYREIKRRMAK